MSIHLTRRTAGKDKATSTGHETKAIKYALRPLSAGYYYEDCWHKPAHDSHHANKLNFHKELTFQRRLG